MYSRRRSISSWFWDICVKVKGWHQVTSSVTLYIIGTGSFAEPGVHWLCPTGWSSCSRNVPVDSAGIRVIEVRISYTTALHFHHILPSFPSLTPNSSQVHPDFLPHPNFISSLCFWKIIHQVQSVLPILMGVEPFSRALSPYQGHSVKQTDSYL